MLCIKAFQFDSDSIIGQETHDRVDNAVLKFPPNHPISQEMLHAALYPYIIKSYDSRRLKRKKLIRKLTFNKDQIG